MHYPVMTEKHVADRWQVSLKTLRRWRLDGEGPVWHKLFRHVRYHEADVLEFEHSSAQHLMTLLGIKRDFKPEVPEAAQGLDAKAEDNYFTAKEIAEAASLPIHLFRDQTERNRKRVPHLMLVYVFTPPRKSRRTHPTAPPIAALKFKSHGLRGRRVRQPLGTKLGPGV